MSARIHEELGGGMLLQVDAWGFESCNDRRCEECEYSGQHYIDYTPAVTFFWNVGIAIALAAENQRGRTISRPISERHHYRGRQIEKLRHQLRDLVAWAKPVEVLTIEAEVMHNEVARLRAALSAIAALNIGIASDAARRALGERKTEAA